MPNHKRFYSTCMLRNIFVLLILSGSLSLSSCKKRDLTPPSISLTSPRDGAGLEATQFVSVKGRATDESGSVSITLQLESPTTGQIFSSKTGGPDQNGDFSIELELGDRYTPTETYILRASAFDPAGNKATDFIDLYLTELPHKYYKTVFSGYEQGAPHTLFTIDTFDQVLTGPSLGSNLVSLHMDNRSRQLIVAQAAGKITSYGPTDYGLLYNLDLGSGSPNPSDWPNPQLKAYQGGFFSATLQPPYLRRFNKNGNLETTYGANYPVFGLSVDPDGLFAGMSSPNGNIKKVDQFDRTLGQVKSSRAFDWVPKSIFRASNDQLLVGGEDSGEGRVLVLAANNINQNLEQISLSDPVVDIFGTRTNIWVRQTSRISTYLPDSRSIGLPSLVDDYTAAAWDEQRQELWTGKNNLIEVYSSSGSLLRTYSGNFGVVTQIDFHYNK